MGVLAFFHKASLLLSYSPKSTGRWKDWAGLKNGEEWDIVKSPKLFGKDEWVLQGGKVVSSQEIFMILDRGEFGY